MPKVTLIQQVFNSRKWMELVYPAMVNQTFKDCQIVAQIVSDDGNDTNGGSCEEYICQNFPQIIIEKPGYNIGFARGHNEIFDKYESEFYQLVNPDLILEPDYVEKLVQAFEGNPKLGAATGKLLQYKFDTKEKTNIIDTTGIVISKNGRGRDRGQHAVDTGQYDNLRELIAVPGAGSMHRRVALESVSYKRSDGRIEYFDDDFGSYWEDSDYSLRAQNFGWECGFVPEATAYHGRTAASSTKGYKDVAAFIKHHEKLSVWVKQLNYKNHIFMVIKNFPNFYWKFFLREFFMLGYIILLERSTLKILPTFFKQLPLMWKKRKWIKRHRKSLEWTKLLNNKGLLG